MAQIGCYDNQILTPNCEKSVTHGKNDWELSNSLMDAKIS